MREREIDSEEVLILLEGRYDFQVQSNYSFVNLFRSI